MCEPTTIALAITAVSAVASLEAQDSAVNAQSEANKRAAESANQANNANQAALTNEQNQQAEATAEQIAANNKGGAKAIAAAKVSAGEAGVSGTSVDSLLRELAGMNSADNANATSQYLRGDANLQARRTNSYNSANSVINNLKSAPAPDYLGAALKIGQAGVNYYGRTQTPTAYGGQYNYAGDASGERFSATGESVRSRR